MLRKIVIEYDDSQLDDDGEPFDLFGWLMNELENDKIEANLLALDDERAALVTKE